VAGKGRGGQSAERIGGGAVLGTIIGAIAGGGKGAAIGGVVGAGAGTAVQVSTKGDKVRIPSETLLEFKLQQDVTAPLPAPSN
jgi:outer membrane lipoprotein SlyB